HLLTAPLAISARKYSSALCDMTFNLRVTAAIELTQAYVRARSHSVQRCGNSAHQQRHSLDASGARRAGREPQVCSYQTHRPQPTSCHFRLAERWTSTRP